MAVWLKAIGVTTPNVGVLRRSSTSGWFIERLITQSQSGSTSLESPPAGSAFIKFPLLHAASLGEFSVIDQTDPAFEYPFLMFPRMTAKQGRATCWKPPTSARGAVGPGYPA